jgi:hypothetical protein
VATVLGLATYHREHRWPRWSGTISELQDATERAVTEIQRWTGEDPEVSIRVVERDGLTITLDQHAELSNALDVRDLSRIDSLTIEVGRYGPASADIRLAGGWLGEGMRSSVRGTDSARVEGLATQLSDALTPRHPVGFPGLYGFRVMFALSAAFFFVLNVGILAIYAFDIDNRALRLAIVFGSAALVTAAVALTASAGPPIDILRPGQRSRYVRRRGRLLALAGTIVLGIATSIIATALYSGG